MCVKAPVLEAIRTGIKTSGRRPITWPKITDTANPIEFSATRQCVLMAHNGLGTRFWIDPPHGPIGSKILVPETWFNVEAVKHAPLFQYEQSRFLYKYDGAFIGCHRWRSPAFAPSEAIRLQLEVTGIGYQLLSDITPDQILAEGGETPGGCIGDGRGIHRTGHSHGVRNTTRRL